MPKREQEARQAKIEERLKDLRRSYRPSAASPRAAQHRIDIPAQRERHTDDWISIDIPADAAASAVDSHPSLQEFTLSAAEVVRTRIADLAQQTSSIFKRVLASASPFAESLRSQLSAQHQAISPDLATTSNDSSGSEGKRDEEDEIAMFDAQMQLMMPHHRPRPRRAIPPPRNSFRDAVHQIVRGGPDSDDELLLEDARNAAIANYHNRGASAAAHAGNRHQLFARRDIGHDVVITGPGVPKRDARIQAREDQQDAVKLVNDALQPAKNKQRPKRPPQIFKFSPQDRIRSGETPQDKPFSPGAYRRKAEKRRRKKDLSEPPTMVLPTNFKARFSK